MKKLLFLICIITVLISCIDSELENTINIERRNIIHFSSLYNKITRKANENGHPYRVYAQIDGHTDWYIQTDVHAYDTIQNDSIFYWPGTDTITFYSFAPHFDSSMIEQTFTSDPPSLLIKYQPLGQGNDFTIATPKKQACPLSGENSKVALVFKHMLSAIQISIKLSSDLSDAGYSLNENVHQTSSDSAYSVYLQVPFSIGTINAADSFPTWNLEDGPSKKFSNNVTFFILPQTYNTDSDTCTIQFDNICLYRNGITVFDDLLMSYTLKDGDLDNNSFKQGYNYNIVFTMTTNSHDASGDPIFGEEIVFGSSITSWDIETGININQP